MCLEFNVSLDKYVLGWVGSAFGLIYVLGWVGSAIGFENCVYLGFGVGLGSKFEIVCTWNLTLI